MNHEAWNERYRVEGLVWGAEPNRFVAEVLGPRRAAGGALDLACGEGRNAIWLAKRGWSVTAVDFSEVAIERARRLAASEDVEVDWLCADVTSYEPAARRFALVLVSYLQVRKAALRLVLDRAATALAPGGELLMIGHALSNLTQGVGGPRDPSVLWDPEEIAEQVRALGLRIDRCEEVLRPVAAEDGAREAIDVLVQARRESNA
jgi:SAM-dependent methyltransferase